jgi:hypothetical protein
VSPSRQRKAHLIEAAGRFALMVERVLPTVRYVSRARAARRGYARFRTVACRQGSADSPHYCICGELP